MSTSLDKSCWARVKFGDVVRNANDTVRDPQVAGIDRVIAMEHLDPGELKIHRWGSVAEGTTFTRRVTPGQTLFGKRRAYQRKVAFAEFEAVCSGDIYTFEAIQDRMLPEFLPFLVQSEGFFDHALGTSAGSLSPRTNWRDLAKYEIDLPPLDEQKRIADLLWAIERHRESIVNIERRISTAQSAWLERALDARTGTEWPSMAVRDLVMSGPTNGKSVTANDEDRGVPTLSISAIRDGRVIGGAAVKHIDIDPKTVASFVIEPGDVFVVRGNGNKRLTGLAGLAVGGLPSGCVFPDLLIRLRFDQSRMLPEFAVAQWNSSSAHSALLRHAKSTNGIWKVNGRDLKSHQLIVPPIAQQELIIKSLRTLSSTAEVSTAERDNLATLTRTYLIDIFGGH